MPSNDYLGAGLAESLITSLASVPRVTVLSRSAVEESRQQNPDRASFVRSLDASYIVDRIGADRVRSAARDAESRAAGCVGGVGRNGRRADRAICSRCRRGSPRCWPMRLPIRRRRRSAPTPAAPIDQQRDGADRLLERPRAPRSPRPDRQHAGRADGIRATPSRPIRSLRWRYAGLAEAQWAMYSQTNDKTWADNGDGIDRDARSSSNPIGRAFATSPALTLFRSGDYAEARAGARARAGAAADLRGCDPAARHAC